MGVIDPAIEWIVKDLALRDAYGGAAHLVRSYAAKNASLGVGWAPIRLTRATELLTLALYFTAQVPTDNVLDLLSDGALLTSHRLAQALALPDQPASLEAMVPALSKSDSNLFRHATAIALHAYANRHSAFDVRRNPMD